MIEDFRQLIESHNELAAKALIQYQPIVEEYIDGHCKDSSKIAYTLDFMLDFCFDTNMLQLYRKLCSYLYSFDPEAAFFYANAYREMWDEEGKDFGNGTSNNL